MILGDFHFLWECARVILLVFWGKNTLPGSLSNLRAFVNRILVDKAGKTFHIIDEFIQHVHTAHLLAAICDELQIESPHDNIPHAESLDWLEKVVKAIVEERIMPSECSDPLHKCFLYTAFMYIDLRNAIRDGDGVHIIRHWRHWFVLFLGTNRKNYAIVHLSNLAANYPRHIAIHNRSVNTSGNSHHYKPLDQMLEHYNL